MQSSWDSLSANSEPTITCNEAIDRERVGASSSSSSIIKHNLDVNHQAENISSSDPTDVAVIMTVSRNPQSLWCENLSYTVGSSKACILDDVTCIFPAGQLTAIMGPSGSGKTSLLNCMLARINQGTITGDIGMNASPLTREIARHHANFVPAQDQLFEYLTVQETLYFAAELRLPHLTRSQQVEAADQIMHYLHLDMCRQTLVGGQWRKGISKGQMKRLAIAQELLGNPDILLLDEPTTGLDAALALELICLLRKLATQKGIAVICSIHQPSSRTFALFDHLLLISDGRLLYQGDPSCAVQYFQQQGKATTTNDGHTASDPDLLLSYASVQDSARQEIFAEKNNVIKCSTLESLDKIHTAYANSEMAAMVVRLIKAARAANGPLEEVRSQFKKNQRWNTQFRVLFMRHLLGSLRNPLTVGMLLILSIVQCFLLGLIMYNLTSEIRPGVVPYDKWTIWDAAPLVYLTEGIDRDPSASDLLQDPLRELISNGEDNNQTSLIFDIALNQDMVQYIADVARCVRTNLPLPTNVQYPTFWWDDGSIPTIAPDPVPSTSTTRNETQDQYQWAELTLEQTVSSTVALIQALDIAVKFGHNDMGQTRNSYPSLEGDGGTILGFFIKALSITNDMSTPLVCCLGIPQTIAVSSKTCTQVYPDYTLPVMPPAISWKDTLRALAIATRRLSAARGAGTPIHKLTVNHALTIDIPNLDRVVTAGAARRRLGSGLGGIITDLWNLLFNDPSNPLYSVATAIRDIIDKLKSPIECTTTLCAPINRGVDQIQRIATEFAAAILSVANIGGALFFLVGNLGFATYDVLLSMPKDRVIFNKERGTGLYSTSSFMLSRMVAELPFQLMPGFCGGLVYWFLIGMTASPIPVLEYIGLALLTIYAAYSFGYLISAYSPRIEVAVVLSPLLLIVMLVLCGFFIRDPLIPAWIRWFRYVSFYRWAFMGLVDIVYPKEGYFGILPSDLCAVIVGATERRLWLCNLMLLALGTGARFISFFGMAFLYTRVGLQS